MRTLGAAVLGLLAGALAGVVLTEFVVRIGFRIAGSQAAGNLPLPLAILLGSLVPVGAIVGLIVGLGIASRERRRDSSN